MIINIIMSFIGVIMIFSTIAHCCGVGWAWLFILGLTFLNLKIKFN